MALAPSTCHARRRSPSEKQLRDGDCAGEGRRGKGAREKGRKAGWEAETDRQKKRISTDQASHASVEGFRVLRANETLKSACNQLKGRRDGSHKKTEEGMRRNRIDK